jgi:hypothetical protein
LISKFFNFSLLRHKLIKTPYANLVQEYTTCTSKPMSVVLNQLGSAFGSMDFIVPLAILITIGMVYCYQKLFLNGEEIAPETYSGEEKASALNALATSLLLTRDHLRYYQRRQQQIQSSKPESKKVSGGGADSGIMNNNNKIPSSNPAPGTLVVKRKSTSSTNNKDDGMKTVDFEHTDFDDVENQLLPKPSSTSSAVPSAASAAAYQPVLDEDLFDNNGEETNLDVLRAENILMRKMIYPLLKILSDDSSYHSDARHLKKVVDFMQPPAEDVKNIAGKSAMVYPEGPSSPDGERGVKGREEEGEDKESDYLLRLSREMIDEQQQREEAKKRRQEATQLLFNNNTTADKNNNKMAVSEKKSAKVDNNNSSKGVELVQTVKPVGKRNDLIILNKPARPTSATDNNDKRSNYLIQGKENILKKLKEMLFIFQQHSDSVARANVPVGEASLPSSPREKDDVLQSADSLLLIDEATLGNDRLQYYQCLYDLLLTHVVLVMKSGNHSDGEAQMNNSEAQKMAYQVGGGMTRNGPLKDKVSYYCLQDLQNKIHALS